MEGRQPVCWPPLSAWLMRCPLCGPEAGEEDLWPHEGLPVAGLGAPHSCSQDPLLVLSRALQRLDGLGVDTSILAGTDADLTRPTCSII